MTQDHRPPSAMELTAQLVTAYLARHNVTADDLPGLIDRVREALGRGGRPALAETLAQQEERPALPAPHPVAERQDAQIRPPIRRPAIPIEESRTAHHLYCLEDGKPFKALKTHLTTIHGMTPEQYRSKWGLPPDYPMVAPAYSAARKEMAHRIGLGRRITGDKQKIKRAAE